uniref:Uncharacterized protein n=1 Tax=Arundo donax TaxID=35708 RepID=A0A0A9C6U0_ARUDO
MCQMRILSSNLDSAIQARSPDNPLLSNASRPHCPALMLFSSSSWMHAGTGMAHE